MVRERLERKQSRETLADERTHIRPPTDVGDYNLLNSKEGSIIFSRFTTPIEEMRNVASFCLAELERLEDRLEELSSSGGHTWLASAGDDEHDDSGVFFVLSCRSTPDSMSLLDVAIAKMHVGWVSALASVESSRSVTAQLTHTRIHATCNVHG